jgi:hypothetical protein
VTLGVIASPGFPYLETIRDYVRELPEDSSVLTLTSQPNIGRAAEEICSAIGLDFGLRAREELLFRDCERLTYFSEAGHDSYLNYLDALSQKHLKPLATIGV